MLPVVQKGAFWPVSFSIRMWRRGTCEVVVKPGDVRPAFNIGGQYRKADYCQQQNSHDAEAGAAE